MTTRLFPLLLLALAACGQRPSAGTGDTVAVVAGVATPAKPHAAPVPAPMSTTIAMAAANPQPKLLTVEESAHIQSSEMWSEPIIKAN